MTRWTSVTTASLVLALSWAVPVTAAGADVYPDQVFVPDGFYPEGIAVGRGHDVYVGSLLAGAVYKADLRTGDGAVLAPPVPGRIVVGLSFDERSGLLWAVGLDAGNGAAFAFDGDTGELVVQVAIPGAFLNDLVVTRTAAYVTDSFAAVLWTFPLDAHGLPAGPPSAVPLTGDFTFLGPGDVPPGGLAINLNGIDATPDGGTLIANHTTLGVVYRIDPGTGVATAVDLGGSLLPSGDGVVLHGRTLYVVQNFLNTIAVVDLDRTMTSGRVSDVITSTLFRIPTTAALLGDDLYTVNSRFDEAFPPILGGVPMDLEYDVVRVPRR